MQMTEDLIRNVVQEVLSQMGNGAILANGKAHSRLLGNLGVFGAVGYQVDLVPSGWQLISLGNQKRRVDRVHLGDEPAVGLAAM
jgi:aldehyde dehydrogenase